MRASAAATFPSPGSAPGEAPGRGGRAGPEGGGGCPGLSQLGPDRRLKSAPLLPRPAPSLVRLRRPKGAAPGRARAAKGLRPPQRRAAPDRLGASSAEGPPADAHRARLPDPPVGRGSFSRGVGEAGRCSGATSRPQEPPASPPPPPAQGPLTGGDGRRRTAGESRSLCPPPAAPRLGGLAGRRGDEPRRDEAGLGAPGEAEGGHLSGRSPAAPAAPPSLPARRPPTARRPPVRPGPGPAPSAASPAPVPPRKADQLPRARSASLAGRSAAIGELERSGAGGDLPLAPSRPGAPLRLRAYLHWSRSVLGAPSAPRPASLPRRRRARHLRG
ncbi:basic salivary proline-rich protein 1-like [Notechis scutatus]|uniref:Basic salivary proline-rich protein 1-like n=1 Tax=Notechis scutatus TaxID=8663 RepID=A0A6J1VBB9_9SAUR|nr:basic salivary proline-rich protein 1-like [Notechis scutatus]